MGGLTRMAAVGVLVLCGAPTPGWTQAKPAAPPSEDEGDKTVETVTVTAPSQEIRSDIDRRSFSVTKDLQSTTGSLADVLRNVPSVSVDMQGGVTLRGDPNVVIMIDGKPSSMFSGEGRASALQSMSGDQFERVEVITNPSAAMNPEGSGGVINLISKTGRKPGYSGSVRASLGERGRYNTGLSGAYNSNALTVTGEVSARGRDPQRYHAIERRQRYDVAGNLTSRSRDESRFNGLGHMVNARLAADYDIDRKTRLSGQVRRLDGEGYEQGLQGFDSVDAAGEPDLIFDRLVGRSPFSFTNTEVSGTWRRQFAGEDHQLTATARRERSTNAFERPDVLVPGLPAGPEVYGRHRFAQATETTGWKVDYQRPLSSGGKLKAGYELQLDRNVYDSTAASGPSVDLIEPDPALTDVFRYRQAINSGYWTYEQPLGELTVLAGLRLEHVGISFHQLVSGERGESDYVRAYPSLHLSRPVGDGDKLTASYGRRVQRPRAYELNPLTFIATPLFYRRGNPDLKPQMTDAFEAAYEHRKNGSYYLATVFYRETRNAIVDVTEDVGGGVLVFTRKNLGESRSAGVELVTSGKLHPKLGYNLTGSLLRNEIEGGDLGFNGRRSGWAVSGRASLDWQATAKDFLQVQGSLTGRRLTPQGYFGSYGVVNLGYRRQIKPALFGLVTVQDALDSYRSRATVRTPAFEYRRSSTGYGRTILVGLTYNFGGTGKAPKEPAFDFGGGGPQ